MCAQAEADRVYAPVVTAITKLQVATTLQPMLALGAGSRHRLYCTLITRVESFVIGQY